MTHQPPPYGFAQPSAPPSFYGPPPAAPPSYAEASGGVPPSSPFQSQPVSKSTPPIVTTVVPVGPHPTHMICPHCHVEIESSTKREPGIIAYLSGIVIFLLGCPCGCCLIPCCIDSCMDVHHTCPNCNAYLGRFRR